ncbi:peptidylprolyl isomerase [Pseudoduganella umbonata]|uniref:Chaperone SurA n=1 Tax=Pseudoduganella umbonata TaxID=864828 RepID=A0A4P8HQQ7_9BURK|nr:peptidylprolyl isomerase [Pseudoduganella umbonata]MBB3220337.1 peptidyl-prolyl cis-trans isomerase SurA [Pseudoduganella umbonata]QCP12123.1 molecular chaperone SurA [Pseudoduganella umbonata]
MFSKHPITLATLLLCAMTAGGVAAAQDAKPADPAKAAAPAAAAAQPTTGFTPPGQSRNPEIDSIAVVVNDDVITRRELAERVGVIVQRMKQQNVQLPDNAALQRQILERMIVERAQLQMAKEMGVRVDDTMLDRAIARIAEQQKLSVQQLRDQIEKDGTSFANFREEIREEIITTRLREHEVDAKIQISEGEVDSFLAAQEAAAAEQQELNISQIMVRIPENASPEVIAQRQQRAEDVMRQLRTGGDFAKVAATYSDAADALQGGAVGWRPADRIPPVFAQALEKLQPGQVTSIIRSATGFHILKLVDKRTLAQAQAEAAVEQTHARHILLKVTPATSAEDAKRKLAEMKARLDSKASTFEELARLYSTDESGKKGGDLGWLYPGDTLPEFEKAMNELKPGEVSGPVETAFGYHLIQVVERKSEDMSKEKKRNEARMALRERKMVEAAEDFQREVRDRAYVEYRSEDLRAEAAK